MLSKAYSTEYQADVKAKAARIGILESQVAKMQASNKELRQQLTSVRNNNDTLKRVADQA